MKRVKEKEIKAAATALSSSGHFGGASILGLRERPNSLGLNWT